MNDFDQTQVSPEIVASADERAASVNGFGSATPEVPFEDRPEVLLGGAFVGGFLLAKILRSLRG
jgi:hypothetical protein